MRQSRVAPPRRSGARRLSGALLLLAWLLLLAALGGGAGYLALFPGEPTIARDRSVTHLPPVEESEAAPPAPSQATPSQATPSQSAPPQATPPQATPPQATPHESEAGGGEPEEADGPALGGLQSAPIMPPAERGEPMAPEAPAALPDPESQAAAPPPAETQEAALPRPAIPEEAAVPSDLPQWQLHRSPVQDDGERPRVAVVLTGLGLSEKATEAAIRSLPAAITLSFSPYAHNLERWIALARAHGHEVLIDLPMEPANFPDFDPGPEALMTDLPVSANLARLDWALGRGSAVVGVASYMGSRFLTSEAALAPVLGRLAERGLLFLDNHSTDDSVAPRLARRNGLPFVLSDRTVDERLASSLAIDARLAQIERIALTGNAAVAMAQSYPVTIDRLATWARDLNARGIVLAPITAMVGRQQISLSEAE